MGRGPRYRVAYRRRREAKTDYKARRILAISDRPRFVVRLSNKNVTIQLVHSKIEGDYVLTQVDSSELRKKYGWLGGSKNTPATYLLGMLAGKKALKEGIEEANLDLGLARPTKGSKIFAAVKGALDAGMEIPCDPDILPDASRIDGSTIAEYASGLEEPSEYKRLFSGYLERGLKPEGLQDHFSAVKAKIEEEQDS